MAQTVRRRTVRSEAARRALAHTLRVVLAHFADHGVTAAGRAAAMREALERTDEPLQRHEASALHAVRARVELLAAWHRQSRYLGADGEPAPLQLSGAPSLGELLQRFLPTADASALVRQLEAENVVRREGRDHWLPVRRTLMVASESDGAVERLPFQIHALLSTLAHNARAGGGRMRRLERTVYSDRLPLRLLADFDVYSKRLGGQVIHELDNWLLRREQPADAQEPCVSVGVNLHAFVEGTAVERSAPMRARRRRKRP